MQDNKLGNLISFLTSIKNPMEIPSVISFVTSMKKTNAITCFFTLFRLFDKGDEYICQKFLMWYNKHFFFWFLKLSFPKSKVNLYAFQTQYNIFFRRGDANVSKSSILTFRQKRSNISDLQKKKHKCPIPKNVAF